LTREGSANAREKIGQLQRDTKKLEEAGARVVAVVAAVVLIIVVVVAVVATFGFGTTLTTMAIVCCIAVIAASVAMLAVTVVMNVGPLLKGSEVVARRLGLHAEGGVVHT